VSEVSYQFVPWVRSGLAATNTTDDTLDAETPGRATLAVALGVSRRGGTLPPVEQRLTVLGPGEVVGLDPRQIIRTDPLPGATDAEPNMLVQVELDRPDLPWLFTPAAADSDSRLRPWLVLVVVAEGPGVTLATAVGSLPVLTLTSEADPARQLPDLGESWAWAHGQAVLLPGETAGAVLAGVPERNAARLLCPRRLDPMTRYIAALVPAFEAGRRAGLGLPAEAADEAALRPAWSFPDPDQDPNPDPDSASDPDPGPTVTKVELPVYYSFRFATGIGGDFESLARALRPRPLPEGVGHQPVYVGAAGEPLPAVAADADGAVVSLPGALVPPGDQPAPWPDATRDAVEQGLAGLLDAAARRVGHAPGNPAGDPAVAPPLYGQWAAAVQTVPAASPTWLRDLNLDPRHRAVAGLGGEIVDAEQDRLMDEAWAQIGAVEAANRELRWAQLARTVRGSLLRRHVEPMAAPDVLALTAPVHIRVLAGEQTLASTVTASALPDAVVTPAFRRALGPRAATIRRLARAAAATPPRQFATGLDEGFLRNGSTGPAPDGMFTLATDVPQQVDVSADVRADLQAARTAARNRRRATRFDPVEIHVLDQVEVTDTVATRVAVSLGVPTTSARRVALAFQAAVTATAARSEAILVPAGPAPDPLGIGSVLPGLLERLDPAVTVAARIRTRIVGPLPPEGRDPLRTVLAAPQFPRPAWEYVRDHAPHLLLPGLHRVPQDTVTLAETNPAFAEALLVGLNHEMARELLWREYPTDQRGTCFHRFWAPGGLDDIDAIDQWGGGSLGTNTAGEANVRLVLVLRGWLLYRYPGTVIYAAPDHNGRPDISTGAVVLPTFRGRVEPDVAFVGFPIGRDDAPNWWFVLEEQPTAPRFGLDVATEFGAAAGPVNEWNDLSWGHLADSADALAELNFLRADTVPPSPPTGPRWGTTSAALGAILAQQPVRVAMRAVDLLPPEAPS
jgi:hypothetical protein